jgi:hypothetical protein
MEEQMDHATTLSVDELETLLAQAVQVIAEESEAEGNLNSVTSDTRRIDGLQGSDDVSVCSPDL